MNEYLFRNRAAHFGFLYNNAIRLLHHYANVLPASKYSEILKSVYSMGTYMKRTFTYLDKYQLHTAEDIAVLHHDLKQEQLLNSSYSMLARHHQLHLGDVDRDRFIQLLHNKSHNAERNFARAKVQDRRRHSISNPYYNDRADNYTYTSHKRRVAPRDRFNRNAPESAYNPFAQSNANETRSASSQLTSSASLSLSASYVASKSNSVAEATYRKDQQIADDQNLNYDGYTGNLDKPLHHLRQDVDATKTFNPSDEALRSKKPSSKVESHQSNQSTSSDEQYTQHTTDEPSDDTASDIKDEQTEQQDEPEQQPDQSFEHSQYGGVHEMNMGTKITPHTHSIGTGETSETTNDTSKDDAQDSATDSDNAPQDQNDGSDSNGDDHTNSDIESSDTDNSDASQKSDNKQSSDNTSKSDANNSDKDSGGPSKPSLL